MSNSYTKSSRPDPLATHAAIPAGALSAQPAPRQGQAVELLRELVEAWTEWSAVLFGGNAEGPAARLDVAVARARTLLAVPQPSQEGVTDAQRLNDLMVEHDISVWIDPNWMDGLELHRWLAGKNVRAVEGMYYSTLTGSDPATIEADHTASGDTPLEAVLAAIRQAQEGGAR